MATPVILFLVDATNIQMYWYLVDNFARKLDDDNKGLLEEQKKHQSEIESSQKVIAEAGRRLSTAFKSKKTDPAEIHAAQALLESGQKTLEKATCAMKSVNEKLAKKKK